jgi:replicative DNA helicase
MPIMPVPGVRDGDMSDLSTLPNDIDMERACIASALVDEASIPLMIEAGLQRGHFWNDKLGNAWDAVLFLFERSEPVNQITVANILAQRQLLDDFGGSLELGYIVRSLVTSQGAEWYAGQVVQLARRRVLLAAVTRSERILYQGTDEEVQRIPEIILRAASDLGSKGLISYQDALSEEVAPGLTLADIIMGEQPVGETVATGLKELDEMLGGGLMRQNMYTLLARPSAGKSWFCLNVARNALKEGRAVLYVNTEMGTAEIVKRVVFLEAGYDRLRYLHPAPEDIKEVVEREKLEAIKQDMKLRFLTGKPTIDELTTKVKLAVELYGVSLVIVDTLQAMAHKARTPQERVGELAAAMKGLALKYNVAMLTAHHVARGGKGMDGSRTLARLDMQSGMWSAGVEQESDAVLTLEAVEWGSQVFPDANGWGLINEQRVGQLQKDNGWIPVQITAWKNRSGLKWGEVYGLDWDWGGRFRSLLDIRESRESKEDI